jgi:NADH-quinone oxidoreductase subunit G
LGVNALGVINRGVVSEIAPNRGDHLECDECGACIDICPVGALTSGAYRYKTRPWEMTHVATICAHCSDGCTTTLGVRNDRIIRGTNRDRSGVNGEFLCIKGRYGFDFYDHPERLLAPLIRVDGELRLVSWAQALKAVAEKFNQTLADGGSFGVIGSNHTTNEENFYLRKFASEVLRTSHIDHHRTGDLPTLLDALGGAGGQLATVADLYQRKAFLILGADLALEHPLLSYQIRANYRHHRARVYVVTPKPVREDKYAAAIVRGGDYESLREQLKGEPELVILFDDSCKGDGIRKLVEFGASLGIPVKYICLLDYSNSRGAVEMGLTPGEGGMRVDEMLEADLSVLWVVGANPFRGPGERRAGFVVVQELFLTETAQVADVVLPAACAYEKNGTVTNVTGEVQRLRRAVNTMGAKPDLEIMGFLAREMGAAAALGEWTPEAVSEEIRKAANAGIPVDNRPGLAHSDHNGLFASGTLGRYSRVLNSVVEGRLGR